MSINMSSIMSKARKVVKSTTGKQKIDKVIDEAMLGRFKLQLVEDIYTPEETAEKFIQVLRRAISTSGLSDRAIAALDNLDYSEARKLSSGMYIIYVFWAGNMSRPSLLPSVYGDIEDLPGLLNDGVDHKMKQIKGVWHGEEYRSRTVIPGAGFMEQAVSDFMGNYSDKYNVTGIEIIRE